MSEDKLTVLNGSSVSQMQKMWEAMSGILYADELAYVLNSTSVNSFEQFSSQWVVTLEERIEKLNKIGGAWHNMRADITAGFLAPFVDYSNRYDSINEMLVNKKGDAEDIVQLIKSLYEKADENADAIRSIKTRFQEWMNDVNSRMVLLEESVADGWKALDVEENSVAVLTGKLAVLQNALENVEEDILPQAFKVQGKFACSYGKIIYSALIAGKSVSYLSAGSLFVSVGKIFWNALSSYMDVENFTKEVKTCKQEYSFRQQALAQTKALLRFLQSLQLKVVKLENEFREIVDLWDDEKSFIRGLLLSYQKGADPKKTVLIAENAMWQTTAQYAKEFMEGSSEEYHFSIEL